MERKKEIGPLFPDSLSVIRHLFTGCIPAIDRLLNRLFTCCLLVFHRLFNRPFTGCILVFHRLLNQLFTGCILVVYRQFAGSSAGFLLPVGFLLPLFFISCQKDISVDLPDAKEKICVEGKIEPGLPPYVILTKNMPYFGSTDISSMQNLFIHDAVIIVSNGTTKDTLKEYCSQSLPDSLLPILASFTGVDTSSLLLFNYCIYTTFNLSLWGTVGKTYELTIDVNGKHLTSRTKIENPVPLDSTWSNYLKANNAGDSLGFVYAHLTDPSVAGNAYRWLAMRKGKDYSYLAPFGSVTDDKFFNGQSFDFAYNRPIPANKSSQDPEEEIGYYKTGDTVIIKFCTIDREVYEFYRQMDIALSSQGNPFASPVSVASNVYPREDALGVWCGYGTYLDTVIFK